MRNRSFKRKTRNILLLIALLAIILGIYYNVINSRAEKIYEVAGLAIDNYAYLENEEFILEAKQTDTDTYKIELPESVNTKKINQILEIKLEDLEKTENSQETTEQEQIVENTSENQETEEQLEVVDNKITLTKEQMETKKVVIELNYDMAILTKTEEGEIKKELLSEKTEEERNTLEITEDTQILYSKILKYEDEENEKTLELRGYLPKDAELQTEQETQEKLSQFFGETKIDVAYSIKVIMQVAKIETNENGEEIETYETIEINPEDFGETYQILIKDAEISENSSVYYITQNNEIEQVQVKENTKGNISFEIQKFSIYAVISEESSIKTATGAEAGEKVTASTLVAEDYGIVVSDYALENSFAQKSVNWKIFHTDGTNIYLIADDAIQTAYVPAGKGNTPCVYKGQYIANLAAKDDYTGTADIDTELMNKVMGMYDLVNTNDNGKATAFLLDTSVWSIFVNSDYAENAIGGPTLELFASSYNATHTSNTIGLGVQQANAKGYIMKWNSTSSYSSGLSNVDSKENVYGIASATSYWIASPSSAGDSNVGMLNNANSTNNNAALIGSGIFSTYVGFRPVIILNSDVELTKQSDGTFLLNNDTTPPTIVIDPKDTIEAKDITAEDYGGYVTNYASNDSEAQKSVGWRIFHSDGENIYLKADNYIENKYAPTGKGGTAITTNGDYKFYFTDILNGTDYTGTDDVSSKLKEKLLSNFGTYTNTNENGKVTAYLLDTNQWSGFANSAYAEYAIGGPTLELFVASWNATHTDEKIETQVVDVIGSNYGYKLKWSTDSSYSYRIEMDYSTIDEESLYFIKNNEQAIENWFASPSAGATDDVFYSACVIGSSKAYVTSNWCHTITTGACPVVSLKSDIQLQKQSDGTYIIVEKQEETWEKTKNVKVEVIDEQSGLAEGATLKYGWSTSTTTEPTEWKSVTLTGYTAGANKATFTAKATEQDALTGKYYLWVKPVDVKDTTKSDANVQTTTSKSEWTYWLDNTAPIIAIVEDGTTSDKWNKEVDVTIKITDEHSGIKEGMNLQYGLSTSMTTEPATWEDANISAYEAGTNQTSFEVTISGLTGQYYIWIRTITLSDIAENSIVTGNRIAFSKKFNLDNTAPQITILDEENASNKLTASNITSEDYGGYVTNYASNSSEAQKSVGWRIFHSDGENIYLIADDYIKSSYVPAGRGGTVVDNNGIYPIYFSNVINDYTGTNDIPSDLKTKLLRNLSTGEDTTDRGKEVAYLLDTNIWSIFANENAEFAVGAPTLELFTESYNITHAEEKISISTYELYGKKEFITYNITLADNIVYGLHIEINKEDSTGLYSIESQDKAFAYWIAGMGADITYISSYGLISGRKNVLEEYGGAENQIGARPVIALKADIKLEKQEDGTYIIYDDTISTEDTWSKTKNIVVEVKDEHSGLATGLKLQYGWSTSNTTQPTNWKDVTLTGYTAGTERTTFIAQATEEEALTGRYYLWVKPINVKDTALETANTLETDNINNWKKSETQYLLDNTAPTITLGIEGNSTWMSNILVGVKIKDEHSGLKSGANIQYGWSTSKTTEPTNWTTANIPNYTEGTTEQITFTASSNGLTGKYYLWVKPINLYDMSEENGNAQENPKISTGTFYLDNIVPSILISESGTTQGSEWRKSVNVTIEMKDEHSGLNTGANIQYGWSTSTITEPTIWNTASIPAYNAGTNQATFEVVASGVTGEYYLWIKTISIEDVVGNSVPNTTKALKKEFYLDNTAPEISIIGPVIEKENKITASDITAEDYGGYVTNYASNDSEAQKSVGWRIFHSDGENIYLIADDYINNTYVPAGKGGTAVNTNGTHKVYFEDIINDYTGTDDISLTLKRKLLSGSALYTNTNTNGKITAYLLDVSQWSGFTNNSYADYAIGSPTLELFTSSWNTVHTNKKINLNVVQSSNSEGIENPTLPEISTQAIIESSINSAYGYKIKWSTDSTYGDYAEIDYSTINEETLYFVNNNDRALAYWLAAPSTYNDTYMFNSLCNVQAQGAGLGVYDYTAIAPGIRPIVVLRSDVELQKKSDGTYIIYDDTASTEDTWSKTKNIKVEIKDEHAGIASGATLKYGWSTSATTEPTEWKDITLTGYTSGARTTTFIAQATNEDALTGKYYLWVKPLEVKDISKESGNEQDITKISNKEYLLDNIAPTITLGAQGSTNWMKDLSVGVQIKDEHSGLKAGANLQYGWSLSNTEEPTNWITADIPDYTEGTTEQVTFTANSTGISGKYYLWIKPTNLYDTSKENGNGQANSQISTGTFYLDNTAPTILISESGTTQDNEWRKSVNVTIKMEDEHSGLEAGASLQYGWSTSTTTRPTTWTTATIPTYESGVNQTTFEVVASGVTGEYYLWIKAISIEDTIGNSVATNTTTALEKKFYLDNTAPEISIIYNGTADTWSKTKNVEVEVKDEHAGLETGASLQYGWSLNSSIEPTEWKSVTLSTYAKGTKSATFTAQATNEDALTGRYYLWIKPLEVKDISKEDGNKLNTPKVSVTTYLLDNTPPTMTLGTQGSTTWVKEISVGVQIKDEHSGLKTEANIQYGWSLSNTTEPETWITASKPSYANGTTENVTFIANSGNLTGKYYLWVKPIEVVDTSLSDGNRQETIIISNNTFYLDNTAPTISIQNDVEDTEKIWYKSINVSVKIQDEDSGLELNPEIQYGWSTSNTTEPSTWATIQPAGYEEGAKTSTFIVATSGLTGEYYLWLKPTTLSDIAGNHIEEQTIKSTKKFYLDNAMPEIEIAEPENEVWAQTKQVEVKIEDNHSGLEVGATLQYGWSTSTSVEPAQWKEAEITGYTSGAQSATFTAEATKAEALTGKYYLWVRPINIKDTSIEGGNPIEQNYIKKSKGVYLLDNTPPTIGEISAVATSESTFNLRITGIADNVGVAEQSGLKGYYVSKYNTAPTENSEWNLSGESTIIYETVQETTTYYIWEIDNANNISEVKTYTTKIINYGVDDNAWYETFADAVVGASNGSTIKVIKNLTDTTSGIINKNIILNLNGKTLEKNEEIIKVNSGVTLEITGNGKLKTSSIEKPVIETQGTLTLKNLTMEGNSTAVVKAKNSGTININGATINGNIYSGTGIANVNSGIVKGDIYGGNYKTAETGNTTINVNGGTIDGSIYGGPKDNILNGDATINIGKSATGNTALESSTLTITGNIYGGGNKTEETGYTIQTLTGKSQINIDGTGYTTFKVNGNILGSGNHSIVGTSNIVINNLGTANVPHLIKSIQRANNLTISNSNIEVIGIEDTNNENQETQFTFNRIGNLKIKNGTTLHLRRGFNQVEELNSLVDINGTETKAQVTIEDGVVKESNTTNRIYVYQGINLIIAKEEYKQNEQLSNYGSVNGMTFFGMYAHDRITDTLKYDIYDPTTPSNGNLFALSSYAEGLYNSNENSVYTDGFYTNIVNETTSRVEADYIEITPYAPTYQDWILGIKTYTQEITMTAKRNKDKVYQSIPFDYFTQAGSSYNITLFSVNSLEKGINLIDKFQIPTMADTSEKANTNFALTLKNAEDGWKTKGETSFYTSETEPIKGTLQYITDDSGNIPYFDLYLHNSLNMTKTGDCGYVNIVFIVKQTTDNATGQTRTYRVAITINLKTEADSNLTEFTTESKITKGKNYGLFTGNEVNISERSSMTFYTNIYPLGTYGVNDYRVLTSTCELPTNTEITMIDYAQGEQPIIYHYIVEKGYDALGSGTYMYNLSNFKLMGTTSGSTNYANSNSLYESKGYEEYRFIFDFKNATINANLLNQTIKLEIRDGEDDTLKNREETRSKFSIYKAKNSSLKLELTENTENINQIINQGKLTFDVVSDITKQTSGAKTINDTYYDDKKLGISISIYDSSNNKVPYQQLVGTYFTIDGQEYYPDTSGTTRICISDNIVKVSKKIEANIDASILNAGNYTIRVETFASANGTHYGTSGEKQANIEISILNINSGLQVEISDADKIIDATTGKTNEGDNIITANIKATNIAENTNIRMKLYKRNDTFNNGLTYAEVSYTYVNLQDYVSTTLSKAQNSNSEYEYLITNQVKDENVIPLKLALKQNLPTGGYKLVFEIYSGDTCIGIVERHLIVANLISMN